MSPFPTLPLAPAAWPCAVWGLPRRHSGKGCAYQCGRHRRPGSIPASGRSLQKGVATHSSVLAWGIPGTEEPVVHRSPRGREESEMTARVCTRSFKSQTLFLLGLPTPPPPPTSGKVQFLFFPFQCVLHTGSVLLIECSVRAGARLCHVYQYISEACLGPSKHKWINLKSNWIKITNQNIVHALRGAGGGWGANIEGKETVVRLVVGDLG